MLPTPTPLPSETAKEDPVASLRDLLERSRTPRSPRCGTTARTHSSHRATCSLPTDQRTNT